jgi:mannose-1-phosphate guanylyltransferase/mannose-6-phosphate isomerase
MKYVVPVILCGGSGTRLWPLSRASYPKQFINMFGQNSLFQASFLRGQQLGSALYSLQPACVVTHEDHRFLALEQVNQIAVNDSTSFFLEPSSRNTAPALTLAALQAFEQNPESILVVLPADQLIENQAEFNSVLSQAIELATQGSIIVLGVPPTHPETGYGYIQRGKVTKDQVGYEVSKFVEKPSFDLAAQYFNSGEFFWNAGIFVLTAARWLSALEEISPNIKEVVTESWFSRSVDGIFIRPNAPKYDEVPSRSIDYAVIEKCGEYNIPIKVLPLNAGWSDVGSWDAIHRVSNKDDVGNVTQGDVLLDKSEGSYVRAESRLVVGVGLKNLTVIETADAVLVANQSDAQAVKDMVDLLAKQSRIERETHQKVYRPWGWYDTIDEGPFFKVKKIHVKPGASLSLQLHHHRSEHWVVVSGVADVSCGDKIFRLIANQSSYIPAGEKHRLANPGKTPLEIIEVQVGSYLGEDDIVRLEDAYGRLN